MDLLKPAWKNGAASLVSWLFDGYWPPEAQADDEPVAIQSPQRLYTLQGPLAVGDAAELYLARAENDADYLLKVSRFPEGQICLDNEQRTLANLLARAGDTTYRKYLPGLVESFMVTAGVRANIFLHEPGFFTLEQVHEQHSALDGRHLAWIFKRLLTVLGFSHRQDTVHAAVVPCHVLVHAASHGLRLVGWGQSVGIGEWITSVSPAYRAWQPDEVMSGQPVVPATDLFMAARCMVYLAGGDPLGNRMPDTVPGPMQRFFHSCLFEGVQMRPHDAWTLLEEFDELLYRLYGPPKFHELRGFESMGTGTGQT